MKARLDVRQEIETMGLGKVVIAAVIVVGAIQLYRPALPNPPVTADLQAPEPVKQILRTSCYDCHSNETRLPWFDQLAPAYWLVARDVKSGRAHLNFSEIARLPAPAQQAMLYESVNQIRLGAMPMPRYTRIHPHAALTDAQIATLEQYLHPFAAASTAPPAAPTQPAVAPAPTPTTPRPVQNEPNGMAFLPDYKNWKPISTTERGDNHTMRVILGNDIAIKAIADKNIQPWPDGAAFAKVAWQQAPDEHGVIHPGKFAQVEFMVKDKTRYASTAGWGWGRWRGTDLKPYGTSAHFDRECVSCHLPVRDNDFVYTQPIERSTPASGSTSLQTSSLQTSEGSAR
jgi:Haem-binding domain/Cytochrome P460